MKTRPRRLLARALLCAACLAILATMAFEVYAVWVQREGGLPLPPHFGNFPRVRAPLENAPRKAEFSFAVVGDTKSMGTFERISEELRELPLDFAVLLGYCSYAGTERDHRYFRAEAADEYTLPYPVFYVVGNHDVSPDEFTVARFEEDYGPSIFRFEYQGCLFIVLRVLNPPFTNEDSIAFLEQLAAEGIGHYRRRFVFMHIPPAISDDFRARKYTESPDIVDLFDRLDIDYVFAGDFHGYARVELRGTTYIVTGGGGAHLADYRDRPQFHHALVMRIAEDSVHESIVYMPPHEELEDRAERLAIAEIYPWLRGHPLAAGLINAAILAVLIVACRWLLFAGGRRKPLQEGDGDAGPSRATP